MTDMETRHNHMNSTEFAWYSTHNHACTYAVVWVICHFRFHHSLLLELDPELLISLSVWSNMQFRICLLRIYSQQSYWAPHWACWSGRRVGSSWGWSYWVIPILHPGIGVEVGRVYPHISPELASVTMPTLPQVTEKPFCKSNHFCFVAANELIQILWFSPLPRPERKPRVMYFMVTQSYILYNGHICMYPTFSRLSTHHHSVIVYNRGNSLCHHDYGTMLKLGLQYMLDEGISPENRNMENVSIW